ncbi:S66 family peptidase [Nocardioides sp.]|uniref:S66 family peptidase n=1 Tax=Nocardioides sp. TaxID=35761 RepID=UPI003D1321D1
MVTYPDKPVPGDRVAILSPGAALPATFPAPYELGLRRLETVYGLVPVEYPSTRVWSSPAERARDVNAAFADPEVKAILTSIGGDDQVRILPHLDADVIRANPKPFFGLSDNSNLHLYLFSLGHVSYYGGTVMTLLGRHGSMNPHSAESFQAALFTQGWYDLRPAASYTDVHLDWADPASLAIEPEMSPGTGWQWHGQRSGVVEGRLWGGCLEIVDINLRVGTHLPDDSAYDGCVLYLETSEELPSAGYVARLLMCMGERGMLGRFAGLLMGRAKAWSFESPNSPAQRADYVTAQREAVLAAFTEYNPDIPLVFDVDLGHTDPQLVVPNGGECRIDPSVGSVSVRY